MNIKDKIIEWQQAYIDSGSFLDGPERNLESNRDLELVLFVIDRLKSLGGAYTDKFSSDSRDMLLNSDTEFSGGKIPQFGSYSFIESGGELHVNECTLIKTTVSVRGQNGKMVNAYTLKGE